MKVTLYMAMSLNGIIARKNGGEDFLSDNDWKEFVKAAKKTGCIIVGRKTYETVMKWEDYTFDSIPRLNKIVVSRKVKNILGKNVMTASSPKDAIKIAASLGKKEVLLAGGSSLNSSFIQENLINEIIINMDPVIVGKGIPLFSEYDFEKKLMLLSSKKLASGILQLHYKMM